MKSPQQAIFDAVFNVSESLGYDTYDYLPANKAKLPFVYVGEQFSQDRPTKSIIYGGVQQRVHIYHSYKNRRDASDMIGAIKREVRKLKRAGGFYISVRGISSQNLLDTTTSDPLRHGIVEIDFNFN